MNEAYCMDCMEYMKTVPDNYFDLAVVDPPYGGAGNEFAGKTRFGQRFDKYKPEIIMDRRGCGHNKYNKAIIDWDNAPDDEYFEELFRVSKNQIIWGGGELLRPSTNKRFSDRGKDIYSGTIYNGDVRICVDFIQ